VVFQVARVHDLEGQDPRFPLVESISVDSFEGEVA
jgi:hypothetical protein